MRPMSPVIPGENLDEIKCAEHQPEYMTLPIIYLGGGNILSRWQMDEAEKQVVGITGELFVFLMTFGGAVPECLFQVDHPVVSDSPEFLPKAKTAYQSADLPVLCAGDDGVWLLLKLTDDDRETLKREGNVYFFMKTGGQPVTPSTIQVEKPMVESIAVEYMIGVRATAENEQMAARHNIETHKATCAVCDHDCLVSRETVLVIREQNLKIICSICGKGASSNVCVLPETVRELGRIIEAGKNSRS